MDLLELQAEFVKLLARNVAQRDIIIRLLAHVAERRDDPEIVLREFFEAGDERVEHHAAEGPQVEMAEAMRREKDLIVQSARQILAIRDGSDLRGEP